MDHANQNREAYDKIADIYDVEVFNRPYQHNWDEKIRSLLDNYVPAVEPSEEARVVDLGCGTAVYSELLSAKGYHVLAVDISEEMIRVAKEKASAYEGRMTTLVSDVLDLQVPDDHFALAISFGSVINHLEEEELDAFFAKASELLIPGSLFIFDIESILGFDYLFYALYSHVLRKPERPPLNELLECVRSLIQSKAYSTTYAWYFDSKRISLHMTHWSLKVVKAMLKARGFQVLELDGTNILSCIIPRVALSATYNLNGESDVFFRMLNRLDAKLGRLLHSVAGVQFVVAQKAQRGVDFPPKR